jgi:hypothetical protein
MSVEGALPDLDAAILSICNAQLPGCFVGANLAEGQRLALMCRAACQEF